MNDYSLHIASKLLIHLNHEDDLYVYEKKKQNANFVFKLKKKSCLLITYEKQRKLEKKSGLDNLFEQMNRLKSMDILLISHRMYTFSSDVIILFEVDKN